MFIIEKKINELSANEKEKICYEKKSFIDDLFSQCQNNENKILTRSKLGKAISNALKYEKGLYIYLDDRFFKLFMTNIKIVQDQLLFI